MNQTPHKHPLHTLLATLAAIAVLASSARAATYYVTTTGNDSTGTGTSSKPWKTIEKAITKAKAGDTVSITAGNYTYETSPIVFTNSGNSSSPISFIATGGMANLYGPIQATGRSYLTLKGLQVQNFGTYDGIKLTACSHVTLDTDVAYNLWTGHGINLQGCSSITVTNSGVYSVAGNGIECDNSSGVNILASTLSEISNLGMHVLTCTNVTIDHCAINHTGGSGIGVWGVLWGQDPGASYPSSGITITYNTLDRCCDGGFDECISIANGNLSVNVGYNTIHDSSPVVGTHGGEGIDVKLAAWNVWIHDNQVHDIQRMGIMADAAVQYDPSWYPAGLHNIYIYNNQIYNIPSGGIQVEAEYYGSGHVGIMDHCEVYNNIIYNNASEGIQVQNYAGGNAVMTNIWIVHNSLYHNNQASACAEIVIDLNPNAAPVQVHDNIVQNYGSEMAIGVYPNKWGGGPNDYLGNAIVSENMGMDTGWYDNQDSTSWDNFLTTNPGYVSPATGNFQLNAGADAKGKGWATSMPSGGDAWDILGRLRPTPNGQDLGAY